MPKYLLYSDGAARGNPGPAGAGAYICDVSGKPVFQLKQYLGETTNNVAEYEALLLGLKKLVEMKMSDVEVRADSELMVKQINGQYRVKTPHLKPLYEEAKRLLNQLTPVTVRHIYREQNKEADRLSNEAIDDLY